MPEGDTPNSDSHAPDRDDPDPFDPDPTGAKSASDRFRPPGLRWVFATLGEGRRVEPQGFLSVCLELSALALVGYLAWLALYGAVHEHFHAAAFAAAVFPLAFLTTSRNARASRITLWDVGLALLSLAVCLWYALQSQRYQDWMRGLDELSDGDRLAGCLLVLLVLELSRRCVGWGLTSVTLALLAYVGFGRFLDGAAGHDVDSLDYFLDLQTMGVDGIFGIPLGVAASYAFLFVWFGALYQRSGGGQLFFDLATRLCGRSAGGAARACVLSSGLYGSISGSPTADVATTGPISIPIMVRTGVAPERAAAIEAAASAGGALLPPVMGAVAFLMADYTGIAYREIAAAALVPALLYYAALLTGLAVEARSLGEPGITRDSIESAAGGGLRRLVWQQAARAAPIVVLLLLLVRGYSPSFVAAGAALAVPFSAWLGPSPRAGLRSLPQACFEALFRVVPLTAAVAAAGLIIGCIELTGLSGKFSTLLLGLSGGAFVPTVALAAGVLLLLGMGMPTPGVYVMGAALVAPILIGDFGVGVLPGHLFILYVSCISAVTPPIAVACFTAASIASVRAMSVAPKAFRLALPGLLVACFFLMNPQVIEAPLAAFKEEGFRHLLRWLAWLCVGVLGGVALAERRSSRSAAERAASLACIGALVLPTVGTQGVGVVSTLWLLHKVWKETDGHHRSAADC